MACWPTIFYFVFNYSLKPANSQSVEAHLGAEAFVVVVSRVVFSVERNSRKGQVCGGGTGSRLLTSCSSIVSGFLENSQYLDTVRFR